MTKKQLGVAFILLGLTAAVALLVVDLIDAGNFQGIGPAQRLGLAGAGILLLVGLSLIPLGDRPA